MRLIVRAGTTKEQNDMDELLNAAYSCWVSKPRRGYIGYSRSVSVAVSLVVRFCQYFQLGALAIVFFWVEKTLYCRRRISRFVCFLPKNCFVILVRSFH